MFWPTPYIVHNRKASNAVVVLVVVLMICQYIDVYGAVIMIVAIK